MKVAAFILITFLTSLSIYGQDITGQWNGLLKVSGVQLRIVFNITKTETGYRSTMDSPDQGAKGIPVTSTSFENTVLKLSIKNLGAEYEGTFDNSHIIKGTFRQMGQSFTMDLSREKVEKENIVRPQEPTQPYPYNSEEVKFTNTQDGVTLAGTLTYPKGGGSFPAVILISGSGAQNRNEELMGHKPFLVLSDYLTRKGIAVLRFDDRGTGESTGVYRRATSADFAKDVSAAFGYLKTRKEIQKNHIGLVGHSEGGIIAPMVAAESKDISFIVLLAGTGIRGDELLLLQQELIGKASGKSESDLQQARVLNKGIMDFILRNDYTQGSGAGLAAYIKQAIRSNPATGKPDSMSDEDFVKLLVNSFSSPWMNYFIKYNPAPTLEKVRCPVLAINGEKDLQVPAKVNLEAIQKALEKGGNRKVTIKRLPDLNHLFQECKTGSPAEYADIEQTFSPAALNEISGWIHSQVK